jgi:hypothetical protein
MANKTDRNDADAILETVTRPSMRFVMLKSVAQHYLLALHRVRAQTGQEPHRPVQPAARSVTQTNAAARFPGRLCQH